LRNDSVQRDTAAQHQFQQRPTKPVIDLNRELPPLPSLDQWKSDDEDDDAYHPGFTKATMTFQQPVIAEPLLDESQAIFDPVTPATASVRPLSTMSMTARPKRVTDINEQEGIATPKSTHRKSLDPLAVLTNSQQQSSQQMTPVSSRSSPRVATIASASSPSHESVSPAVSIRHVHSASAGGSDGPLQTVRLSRQGLARSSSDDNARRLQNDKRHNPDGLYDLSHSKSHGGLSSNPNESRRHQDADPLHRTTSAQRVPIGSKTAQQQRYDLNPLQSHPVSPHPDMLQRRADSPQQQQSERASPDPAAAALSKGRRKWWGGREDKDGQKPGRGRFFSSPPPVPHATRTTHMPWPQRY
jgi:hypothetical protein